MTAAVLDVVNAVMPELATIAQAQCEGETPEPICDALGRLTNRRPRTQTSAPRIHASRQQSPFGAAKRPDAVRLDNERVVLSVISLTHLESTPSASTATVADCCTGASIILGLPGSDRFHRVAPSMVEL